MRLERFRPNQADKVCDVIFRAFRNDPYSWSAGRPDGPEIFRKFLENEHIPSVLAHAETVPTIVAIDDEDGTGGKIIGALTTEDFNISDESRFDQPVFSQAIPALLNACHDIFWRELYLRKGETKENAGRICYFAFLAVDPTVRRKRVGSELAKRSVQEITKSGYRIGVAFCSSFRSTKIFSEQGFEKWGEIFYHSFKLPVDGSIPFESLPDDATTVMVKFF